jgi:hypothetical protein
MIHGSAAEAAADDSDNTGKAKKSMLGGFKTLMAKKPK